MVHNLDVRSEKTADLLWPQQGLESNAHASIEIIKGIRMDLLRGCRQGEGDLAESRVLSQKAIGQLKTATDHNMTD